MSWDPFYAPRQGGIPEDPFGGPVARRAPDNRPPQKGGQYFYSGQPRLDGLGGDVFAPDSDPTPPRRADGRISPTISIEIPGDPAGKRKDIRTFSLQGDVRSLYDPFSFELANPDGDFNYMLGYRHYPIRIWHSDPFVQDGREILIFRGIIVNIEQRHDKSSGTVLAISGYDLGWLMTSCAPYWINMKGWKWPEVAQNLIGTVKSWTTPPRKDGHGFRLDSRGHIFIQTGNRVRDIRMGRQDAEYAKLSRDIDKLAKSRGVSRQQVLQDYNFNIFAINPRIQIEPGETVGDILTRYARYDQRLVNVTPDGDIQVFQPDYRQAPSYVLNFHRDENRAGFNGQIISAQYTLSGDPIYNDVACVGANLFGLAFNDTADPNENKTKGRYFDYNVVGPNGASYLRRCSFADGERWTNERAKVRAKWRFQQNLFEGETLTYTVQGHSMQGVPFIEGTRAEVHDTINGVNRIMYVARVQRSTGPQGTQSVLMLKPDGILAA